jgi:hypothetical protein
MYEIDAWIGEYLQYKAVSKTVFEIKQMERSFDILKFILSICSNLHIMSCTQILICKSTGNFKSSWMGSKGLIESDYKN